MDAHQAAYGFIQCSEAKFILRIPKIDRAISLLRVMVCWAVLAGLAAPPSHAYAVLAHEAIIDAAWDTNIKPLLLARFPNATADELKIAHSYAYGGAIIQDMGYYPHGSKFVSDLAHYVRSGDFVTALLHDAVDLNGYAFALGALAHYVADIEGHKLGTNRAEPVLYPKLEKKFGASITYEQDPLAHVKTEFGFDVTEVAKNRYAPQSYHDFIGFAVDAPLLERAFQETYGLQLGSILSDEDKALNSYRRDVSQLLPKATRIAWSLKQDEIERDEPGITRQRFLYNLSRSSYEKEWGHDYQKPSPGDRFLAFVWKLVPKIGPLKVLQFRTPTPDTERMFEASFNAAMEHYRRALADQAAGRLQLANYNFDTGEPSGPGQYKLNDDTHAVLLHELAKLNFASAVPDLRAELLDFYSQPDAPYATKAKPKKWAKVQAELAQLKQSPAATLRAATPAGNTIAAQ
jgi:hypothetical protein